MVSVMVMAMTTTLTRLAERIETPSACTTSERFVWINADTILGKYTGVTMSRRRAEKGDMRKNQYLTGRSWLDGWVPRR